MRPRTIVGSQHLTHSVAVARAVNVTVDRRPAASGSRCRERGEYRHDSANEAVFGCRPATGCLKKSQDTLSVSLYYKFF